MNVKKAIKRIAAIGTGATLMGATVLGAMAADLADYPAPFVEDGQFNAMLVVGESADTPDVIGAVDIATSLQYEMRTPAEVSSEASEGETVGVSGDNVRIDKEFDRLGLGDSIEGVYDKLTDGELDILADGELADETFTQTIEFAEDQGKVEYLSEGRDFNEDEPGWYMQFDEGLIFTNRMELDSGVALDDLEEEEFDILGRDYTVDEVDGEAITLLGSAQQDTIPDGESATYTLDGKEYEVEIAYGYDDNARFVVNGESTDTLELGESYTLEDGVDIRFVRELKMRDDEPSLIEFHLGSDELVLEDGKELQNDDKHDNVMVGLDIEGDEFFGMHFNVSAYDEEYDIAADDSLSAYFEESEDYMPGEFDLHFLGNTEPEDTAIDVGHDDEQLDLSLDTGEGDYTLPLAWNDGDTGPWIGTEDNVFWVEHPHDGGDWNGTGEFDESGYIYEGDRFVLNTDTAPEDTTSRVFQLRDVDEDDGQYDIEMRDMDGSTREVSLRYDADEGDYRGDVTIGGQTHEFVVVAPEGDDSAEAVAIEAVNNNGVVSLASGTYLEFSGIDFATETDVDGTTRNVPNFESGDAYTITHTVPSRMLDGNTDQTWDFTVDMSGDAVDFDVDDAGAEASGDGSVDVDDDSVWYSNFGVKVWEDEDGEDWEVTVPHSQVLPQVYATGEDYSVSESADTEEASGDAYDIAPVSAGIAQLDTEVSDWENENVIVVGGPCVNTVAAELLGNPEECTEGFEEGVGRIKLFEQNGNVAMLVAGYAADETRNAASVVNDYRDHDFQGTELEVSGTSMSNLDVDSVE
ncbi:MAG: S-layer protein [Candidatus Woesearchaeota archaeon]